MVRYFDGKVWQRSWSSSSIRIKMIINKLKQLSAENPPTSPKEGGAASAAASTPSPDAKENVSPSVFNPGSNLFSKAIGAEILDKPPPSAATG
ncbi:unnamed protein product [Spirodela intermedia]|uniref:Uncharacterized protein n=2 Tax=Spirodela intermedia TaxID=51605 RepID=A0A7I8J252_SPIIN|nr:unnamed protein product [Spirodela intermedia]CAA6664052.1 unnamed protein product [Spirodela intermedia]CAA7400575.1 unnamed protein product [Spirodela intermedia]